MKHDKKGFSLSELLIVVIVIGILAAVVLPRYSKTMETRKTTEAENIMEAVRTEQERRCALSKTYAGDIAQLTDIVPNATTGNFTYSVSGTGVLASSQGSYNYTLKIPSYADGRIFSDGDDCSKLNKDYPTCDDLINNTSDYDADTTCLSAIESEEGVDVIQGGERLCPNKTWVMYMKRRNWNAGVRPVNLVPAPAVVRYGGVTVKVIIPGEIGAPVMQVRWNPEKSPVAVVKVVGAERKFVK